MTISPLLARRDAHPADALENGPVSAETLIAVERHYQLDEEPLAAFIREGWAALIADGFAASDASPCEAGDQALVARGADGAIAGILIFRHCDRPPRTFISFGYVAPDHRRHGIYSMLYEALCPIARKAGSTAIESEVYPDNDAMMMVARRQGRTVSRVILQAKL